MWQEPQGGREGGAAVRGRPGGGDRLRPPPLPKGGAGEEGEG